MLRKETDMTKTGAPEERSGVRAALRQTGCRPWRCGEGRALRPALKRVKKVGCAADLQYLGKLSSLRQQLELVHRSAQFRVRCKPHLPHHVAAMYLDRALTYAHIGGDLLVQAALRNLGEDVEFTRRQRLDARPECN